MTGPDHYREAERLLAETEERRNAPLDRITWRVGQAQVHATLALAAAVARQTIDRDGPVTTAWIQAIDEHAGTATRP